LLSRTTEARKLNGLLGGVAFAERAAALLALARRLRGEADGNDAGGAQTNKRGTMTREQAFDAVVKRFGTEALCKGVIAAGKAGEVVVSEAELVKLVGEHGCRGNESPQQSFTRQWTERGPAGDLLRKAIECCKGTTYIGTDVATMSMDREGLPVRYPGRLIAEGDDALDLGTVEDAEETGEDDQSDAMGELDEATEKMHAQHPELTREQCFAKVYTSQQYRHVAERERTAGRAKLRKAMGFA
jgi:hypothetical protein